MLPQYFRKR